jgi:hypothetical protein
MTSLVVLHWTRGRCGDIVAIEKKALSEKMAQDIYTTPLLILYVLAPMVLLGQVMLIQMMLSGGLVDCIERVSNPAVLVSSSAGVTVCSSRALQ